MEAGTSLRSIVPRPVVLVVALATVTVPLSSATPALEEPPAESTPAAEEVVDRARSHLVETTGLQNPRLALAAGPVVPLSAGPEIVEPLGLATRSNLHGAADAARAHADALSPAAPDAGLADVDHDAPGPALEALLALHGEEPQLDEDTRHGLAELPPAVQAALAELVDAYVGYELAARSAYADLDASALGPGVASFPTSQATPLPVRSPAEGGATVPSLEALGLNLAPVWSARAEVVQAAADLDEVLEESNLQQANGPRLVDEPPVVVVSVSQAPNVYEEDVALLVDVGGQDLYWNNAGGNYGPDEVGCSLPSERPAAALVDLSGEDVYEPASEGCGVIGGGAGGSGLLVDGGGNDTYTGGSHGVNGGATRAGTGLLVDAGGNDTYTARCCGVNGAGAFTGVGGLLDGGGDDRYIQRFDCFAANGGGSYRGVGFLADAGGSDVYRDGCGYGSNGGADFGGNGFLLDAAGDDLYTAGFLATNGGGAAGVGTLVDVSGDDRYVAEQAGTNGGAMGGSVPTGTPPGVPSPAPLPPYVNIPVGLGLLVDGEGTDEYQDENEPTGSGTDRTVAPKGALGAQLDLTVSS